MKKIIISFIVLSLSAAIFTKAQVAPQWTRDINSPSDTAMVFPVTVLHDDSNHVLVLSTYMKTLPSGINVFKIYLKKYDDAGNLLWTLIYDHGGSGNPRGFDMVMDHDGNCFIAGGLMGMLNSQPLLIRVSPAGDVVWERDSTLSFNTGNYDQIFYNSDRLYMKSSDGTAKFDLSGNEKWSHAILTERMAVDNAGRVIVAAIANATNLLRYDSTGVLDFSSQTIDAKRIAVDYYNNIYLLKDEFPTYELVKYDSAGNFAWNRNGFTNSGAFGDIGFDVLVDYYQDVILIGLNDSIFKISPGGDMIWKKPMNGLDSYVISAEITAANLILVAGSIPDANGYNMAVSTFDLNGNENWSGFYNGNPLSTEFSVDVTADYSGVYVIENNNEFTTLAKFDSPFQRPIDYSLICVDSVWYEPGNPQLVNVRVFNGNVKHVNYPVVQAVSSTGDTIINPGSTLSFFAHLGNIYLTYQDTITVQGITDFRNYTFLISEGIFDTTAVIGWCSDRNISSVPQNENESNIKFYPNPVRDFLTIENNGEKNTIQIFNAIGSMVTEEKLSGDVSVINVGGFAQGIYFVRVMNGNKAGNFKFVKE